MFKTCLLDSALVVYNSTMRNGRKRKSPRDLQAAFLKEAGEGIRTLKAIMDTLPMVAFYL